jgi:photosystem II stability/assembly factor-like uncharacterized protein
LLRRPAADLLRFVMRRTECLVLGALVGCGGAAAVPESAASVEPLGWTLLASPTHESLRGVSVVSPEIVWASGAHGTVLRTIDGGDAWSVFVVPGAEALDFRSLHAFDALHAVVLAAGAPARAFRTEDGGATWSETYTRDVPGIFFDSLAFWDAREGIAIGDPLPGADGAAHFAVLVTHDGGAHWEEREGPIATSGEAAFAASNGCIALPAPGMALFATGGAATHVFRSSDGGTSWSSADAPVTSGLASAGVFAIAFRDTQHGYVVGGDYAAPTSPGSFARTSEGGATWEAGGPLRGFRSSIATADDMLIAVGTSGSELSRDDGERWERIDDVPLNAVAVAERTAFAVGPAGTLARLALREQR